LSKKARIDLNPRVVVDFEDKKVKKIKNSNPWNNKPYSESYYKILK
jgi:hypothetical protein